MLRGLQGGVVSFATSETSYNNHVAANLEYDENEKAVADPPTNSEKNTLSYKNGKMNGQSREESEEQTRHKGRSRGFQRCNSEGGLSVCVCTFPTNIDILTCLLRGTSSSRDLWQRLRLPVFTSTAQIANCRAYTDSTAERYGGYIIQSKIRLSLILFGDSITELCFNENDGPGLGTRLAQFYSGTSRRLDILNRGYGGWNSKQGLEILPEIVSQESSSTRRIRLMVIFFGSNDCVTKPESPDPDSPYLSLGDYISNMTLMIKQAQKNSISIILVGPAPLNWPQLHDIGYPPNNRTTQQHRAFNDAIVTLGTKMNVPTVGMWNLIMKDVGWREGDEIIGDESCTRRDLDKYFTDGLHFKGRAYEILYEGIIAGIKASYPALLEPFPNPEQAAIKR